MFRALAHRNYRLYFYGQSISLIGTWMQTLAVSWLVYRVTSDPVWLGIAGFAAQIPSLVLSPLAGVFVDRFDRYRLLIMTQVFSMAQAAVLASVVLCGVQDVGVLVALSLVLGVINAVDLPVRHAFTIRMVDDKNDLPNAIALNSSMINGSKLIGPAVAGFLIAAFGEGVCIALNAASYVAVIAALFAMRLPTEKTRGGEVDVCGELFDGVRYAWGFFPVRVLLLMIAVVSFMLGALQTLLPVFVREVFAGGPRMLGLLSAASGFGALIAACYLAARKSVVGLGRRIIVAAAAVGAGMLVFATFPYVWVGFLAAIVMGAGMIVQIGGSNMVIQTVVDEDKRGRVMSLYGMAFIGVTPLGSLFGGWMARYMGAHVTVIAGGLCCLIAVAIFWRVLPRFRGELWPCYVRKGIVI
jgi:MFS family permease